MKKKLMSLAVIAAVTTLSACSSNDDADGITNSDSLLQGIQSGETVGNVAETIAALETSINANENISIFAQVDHQANASGIGEELRPTRVTLFGNPRLGTPLMQLNQLAGLDLPQKMFAWTDEDGQSQIAYNSADYLRGRHGLDDEQGTLDTIDMALANLATNAAGQEVVATAVSAPDNSEGITIVPSENDMDTTYNILRDAIDTNAQLTLVVEVDHSANAANVELTLSPTRLIVFGNPNLGTPLMQSGQSIGIDLPQKMLVFEDADGEVSVAYNDPAYLAERHGITDEQTIIDTITQALGNLATVATTAQ